MKKKKYLQPAIEVTLILPIQLMGNSRGWSQDGNNPYDVEQEEEVGDGDKESDKLWGYDDEYGNFLDLD